MRGLFTNDWFRLAPGAVLSGRARRAHLLRIRRGRAWVTVEGTPQDHWLDPGATLRVPPRQLVVVEAQATGLELENLPDRRFSWPLRTWQHLLDRRRRTAPAPHCGV